MEPGVDGISVFKISQKANLSHSAVVANCQRLTNVGIIKTNRIKRKYIFVITEKGIKLFYELEKFQHMAKEINIRY
jgi:predicted transcriptional regulator